MKKAIMIMVSVVAISAVATPVPAYAQETSSTSTVRANQTTGPIEIPVSTHKKGKAGSEISLLSKEVKNGTYTVKVVSMNQQSVHPNSDIIIRSGDSKVVVTDVESKSFQEKTAEGKLEVTGNKVQVSVKLGKDGAFSGGVKVVLTEVKAAQPEQPKEAEKPEVKPVEAKPEAEQKPETEDTPGKGEGEEVPAELPQTGPAAILSGMVGASALGLGAHSWLSSRKAIRKAIK